MNNPPINQRQRILKWFRNVSSRLSTLQARNQLGIMSPANRVKELRHAGHCITLEWEKQRDNRSAS